MENQNKKIFSTILMLVGVLCIVISGGIFVSRTWQYLPEVVKKLCLVAVAAGFFGGSLYLEKRSALRKAPVALYYLGVCFTGFSILGFLPAEFMELPGRLTLAMLGMSVPVILRFVREKGLADLIIQICLTDGMILCVAQYSYLDAGKALLLCMSVFTMVLAGLTYYCEKDLPGEEGLARVSLVAYGIHAVLTIPVIIYGINHERSFLFCVLPVLLVTGSITAMYLAYEQKALRIAQSVALLVCGFALSKYVIDVLLDGMVESKVPATFFWAYLAGLVLMLALNRKELLYVNSGLGLFYVLIQSVEYTARTYYADGRPFCFPYGICMAVAMILWHYLRESEGERSSFYKMGIVFFLLGLNAQAAALWKEYAIHYGVVFWASLCWLFAGYCIEHKSDRHKLFAAICKTFSVFFGVVAVLSNKIIPVTIHGADGVTAVADFGMEYNCFFAGVGIVLLGIIWYSIYQEIRMVQFVGTCCILGVLLLHNLAVPALPNVMFLGILTLAMLVLATILKQKGYAIASAVTLALVVLYLTREVWMSIAWWVYLFVAGVGLVIFAIKKEKAE